MNIKEYSMKIMKYTLWATVGLSLLFASCESILDINPKDRLTTKDYFTNEEQLQLYSNQFYSNNFPGDGDIYRDGRTNCSLISRVKSHKRTSSPGICPEINLFIRIPLTRQIKFCLVFTFTRSKANQ